jgi:hypothetical protein
MLVEVEVVAGVVVVAEVRSDPPDAGAGGFDEPPNEVRRDSNNLSYCSLISAATFNLDR